MKLSAPPKSRDFVGTSLQRVFGSYKKRTPLPGEAASAANDLWARPVYVPTKAGGSPIRPGSMDAYEIPSRGIGA